MRGGKPLGHLQCPCYARVTRLKFYRSYASSVWYLLYYKYNVNVLLACKCVPATVIRGARVTPMMEVKRVNAPILAGSVSGVYGVA